MKKIVFILALIAGASVSSFSQQPKQSSEKEKANSTQNGKSNPNENGKTNSSEKGKINSVQKGENRSTENERNHEDGQHQHLEGQHPEGPKMTPEQKAAKLTQYMTTSLSLTANQQSKISALNVSKLKQQDSIRTKYKGNMEVAKPALKSVRDNYNTNLNTILTTEQKTKWETIKKQKKEEHQKNVTAGTKPKEEELDSEDVE